MPKGSARLTSEELNLIQNWITSGANELDTQVSPPPVQEVPTPTYAWISKNIFERKCVICHNSAKPRGKVDLTTYEKLMASPGNEKKPITPMDLEESTVYIEVAHQKMPPAIKKFTAEEIEALRVWIAEGALNNLATPGTFPTPVPGAPPVNPGPPQANYEWLSKALFARRCNSCHGIPTNTGNINFTNYATLTCF